MTDQDQKVERNDERIEDLEVRGEEAREVAGGQEANPLRWGRFSRMRKVVRYGKSGGAKKS